MGFSEYRREMYGRGVAGMLSDPSVTDESGIWRRHDGIIE